jgi:hypothetical protein
MSAFFQYASKSREHILELSQSLSAEDKTWLRDYLLEQGLTPVLEWVSKNYDELEAFLLATPAKRSKTKKWNTHPDRVLFAYAGLLAAYYAEDYLQVASALESRIYCQIGYREMTSKLGMDMFLSGLCRTYLWPFEIEPELDDLDEPEPSLEVEIRPFFR